MVLAAKRMYNLVGGHWKNEQFQAECPGPDYREEEGTGGHNSAPAPLTLPLPAATHCCPGQPVAARPCIHPPGMGLTAH